MKQKRGAKGEEELKIRQRHKAIKTGEESPPALPPPEIHKGRVFDSSASAGESEHDTACQKFKKKEKEKKKKGTQTGGKKERR